ncbi:MAG: hypothetical protein HQK84_01375 [Nitrospinae bacterium]|nr:hypothetical protein [Nitrospinota bacterium]
MNFFLPIATILTLALFAVNAHAVDMKCFKEFHECTIKNKGQFKLCVERKKECESGKNNIKSEIHTPSTGGRGLTGHQGINNRTEEVSETVNYRNPIKDTAEEVSLDESLQCYTISMSQKSCIQEPSSRCKNLSNAFTRKSDCDACFSRYRLPMEKHNVTIFMSAQIISICKQYKRNLVKLAECQRTIKDKRESEATLAYINAQKEINFLVDQAKKSGIPGCGNFARIH